MSNYEQLKAKVSARRRLPAPPLRKLIRMSSGATQQDVAEAVGVSRAEVSRYERGDRSPRGERLVRYVDVLDVLRAATDLPQAA